MFSPMTTSLEREASSRVMRVGSPVWMLGMVMSEMKEGGQDFIDK